MRRENFGDYRCAPMESTLSICAACGSTSGRLFMTTMNNFTRAFDSFECAIHVMAPTCFHCGCRILGHPVEAHRAIYCCAHCAGASGSNCVTAKDPTGFLPTSIPPSTTCS